MRRWREDAFWRVVDAWETRRCPEAINPLANDSGAPGLPPALCAVEQLPSYATYLEVLVTGALRWCKAGSPSAPRRRPPCSSLADANGAFLGGRSASRAARWTGFTRVPGASDLHGIARGRPMSYPARDPARCGAPRANTAKMCGSMGIPDQLPVVRFRFVQMVTTAVYQYECDGIFGGRRVVLLRGGVSPAIARHVRIPSREVAR